MSKPTVPESSPLPQSVPIDRLDDHPLNSNVMPPAMFKKLTDEVARTGLYPPIIVRPDRDRYQILDGHHRVAVLRTLEHTHVQAVVWQIDHEQALILLATLNRLSGNDDPRKRASLISHLTESIGVTELAQRLPENREKLRKLLDLHACPPSPKAPTPLETMPVSVHFFMLPHQRSAVERRLKEQNGTREEALLALLGIDREHAHA